MRKDSERIWACLERIGVLGGYRGFDAVMAHARDARSRGLTLSVEEAFQLPWRWLSSVARLARTSGDGALAGRVFLFMYFFELATALRMRDDDIKRTGVGLPSTINRVNIASEAAHAARVMRPDEPTDGTATAGEVLGLASLVATGAPVSK